jgi:hypothetical protein
MNIYFYLYYFHVALLYSKSVYQRTCTIWYVLSETVYRLFRNQAQKLANVKNTQTLNMSYPKPV